MEIVSEISCFDGTQGVYRHKSECCGCNMTFGLFLPGEAKNRSVPILWYLSGLTCTHENAMTKSGIQIWAAKRNVAVAFPDTSPRGSDVPDNGDYDLGQGAGFYVNATQLPWSEHFQMYDYITEELPSLVFENFAANKNAQGITGHSMGGHGALTIAMKRPSQYQTLSAISPIANPMASDWGQKQFAAYLGSNESNWRDYDASQLMVKRGFHRSILVDYGQDDEFLQLLRPQSLFSGVNGQIPAMTFRVHEGHGHSYFFVMSVIKDHVEHHATTLNSN